PLADRGSLRPEILVVGYGTVAVQSAYFFLDAHGGPAQRVVVGTRLLLPAVPLFLLAYAGVLERVAARFPGGALAGAGAVALAARYHATMVLDTRSWWHVEVWEAPVSARASVPRPHA